MLQSLASLFIYCQIVNCFTKYVSKKKIRFKTKEYILCKQTADRCLTWKFLRMDVAYVVLAVDGWYEQIDERLRSRAVSTHFGLKVLDQLLNRGIELDTSLQHRPFLLRLASFNSSYMVRNV